MTMLSPRHPGETLRDDVDASGLTVTEAAARLGCTRQALSRLLDGKAGISPGPLAGAPRLEQCRLLDAPAGILRTRRGAPPSDCTTPADALRLGKNGNGGPPIVGGVERATFRTTGSSSPTDSREYEGCDGVRPYPTSICRPRGASRPRRSFVKGRYVFVDSCRTPNDCRAGSRDGLVAVWVDDVSGRLRGEGGRPDLRCGN